MLPAAFDYRAPTSLDEALGVLKQHGDEAKVMAGGQSLIPLLKLRFSRPELVIHAQDFFQGPFTTALKPDEVVTEVQIPLAKGRAGGAYLKLERRVGDFATVAVGVQVEMDGNKIVRSGIGLTAVGDRNIKATDAERHLQGKEPTDAVIAEAARLAAAAAEPRDDVRGSAAYKKDVVRVFVQRGLKTAIGRAGEVR